MKRKEKLREKIYDLVYGDDLEIGRGNCMHDGRDPCVSMCYRVKNKSRFYDKLISLLEEHSVYLDR